MVKGSGRVNSHVSAEGTKTRDRKSAADQDQNTLFLDENPSILIEIAPWISNDLGSSIKWLLKCALNPKEVISLKPAVSAQPNHWTQLPQSLRANTGLSGGWMLLHRENMLLKLLCDFNDPAPLFFPNMLSKSCDYIRRGYKLQPPFTHPPAQITKLICQKHSKNQV